MIKADMWKNQQNIDHTKIPTFLPGPISFFLKNPIFP